MEQSAATVSTTMHNEDNENSYQISDDDLDDFEDDCLLDETGDIQNRINCNIRGPYERAWTTDATRALIHIRGPMEGSFTEGRQKRTALWLHCTRQLQRMGFRYSAAKVQKKWHNILITYNKNLSKKYTSGYVHWEFFEEMFKYLQGKKADFEIKQQVQQQQQEIQKQPQTKPTPQLQPLQQEQSREPEEAANNTHMPYISQVDQNLLQPQVQLDTRSNDEFDEDSTTMSEFKQPKLEYEIVNEPCQLETISVEAQSHHELSERGDDDDSGWWKHYFERKLKVESEKIELQRSIQNDLKRNLKMSLMQQERIERLKIEAINNLTATLQRLVEIKSSKI